MALVGKDLLRLKPEMLTWVPHVALFIVTRQMVSLGDPTRRACDACESFGAMTKKIIKHTTCRRHITQDTEHKGKGRTKAWQPVLDMCIRAVITEENLLRHIEHVLDSR